jgi:hypothetical protein
MEEMSDTREEGERRDVKKRTLDEMEEEHR